MPAPGKKLHAKKIPALSKKKSPLKKNKKHHLLLLPQSCISRYAKLASEACIFKRRSSLGVRIATEALLYLGVTIEGADA